MKLKSPIAHLDGYGAYLRETTLVHEAPDTTTAEYADDQTEVNPEKVSSFLVPLLSRISASSVVDVGCGVGSMVAELLTQGYDAHGVDLPGLTRYWAQRGWPKQRFHVVDALGLELPFDSDSVDFVFSLGAMEHVGTFTGQADRRPDYHPIRRAWTRELFRIVRPGGHLLLGGPNRNFPVDVAHAWDAQASRLEIALSRRLGATLHRPWGENFLWGYADVHRYLDGLTYEMEPLRADRLLLFSRVPAALRPLARLYVRRLPSALLASGFSPWVLALVRKG